MPKPKAPPRRKASEESPDVTMIVGTKPYPLRVDDVSGRVVHRLRKESGYGWAEVWRSLKSDKADIDYLAAVMCVSEWQRGLEDLTYEDALDLLTYETGVTFDYGNGDDDAVDVDLEADPDADPNGSGDSSDA